MSAFAVLFGELVRLCVEKYRTAMPIHWDYYPHAPEKEQWRCWIDVDKHHATGSSGEEALRRLHERLSSS